MSALFTWNWIGGSGQPVVADWVTSKSAAEKLGYTVQHVRRLLREGTLEGEKLGRDWMVSLESVNAMLAERENLNLPLDGQDADDKTEDR